MTTHAEHIIERARLVRGLLAERRELFARVPFARALESSPSALERLARPVVALAGEGPADTAAVRQALGEDVPWRWLEVGVARYEEQASLTGDLGPDLSLATLAEHCLLVLSAETPPSEEERAWLRQLPEAFPGGALQLVLVHREALAPPTEGEAPRWPRGLPSVPGLSVHAVSSRGEGIEALREAVARRVAAWQLAGLDAAMKDWRRLLADLQTLVELRPLVPLGAGTLSRLRLGLDEVLADEARRVETELPRVVEACVDALRPRLPESLRRLNEAARERLGEALEPSLHALRARLEGRMARELARDGEGASRAALTDRFGRLVEPEALFFDWRSARTGGLAALGAAAMVGTVRQKGGWALAGAALVGGLVAGLMGRGTLLRTDEELRREVGGPLLEQARRRLQEALETSRADVHRLCDLLHQASKVFASGTDAAHDVTRLGEAISQAEREGQRLNQEWERLRWKHRLEALTAPAPHRVDDHPLTNIRGAQASPYE
ncbi:hypothetical protein [Archangium primigenium]|uniref:hypothetical protein n=1 Tax=[Archangium] primigenium TaxID=2792470 RepID=UPI001958B7D9|nr:hypothetical protein [Archangium primigenium]MBM7112416.1 hypothetical protein [Archangium primigenium]